PLVVDVAGAVAVPLVREVVAVLVAARVRADDDAALLEVGLVRLRAFLGDARADERADDAAGRAARARTREGAGQRPGDGEPEAGHDDGRAAGGEGAEDTADGASGRGTGAGAFHRLTACFDLDFVHVAVVVPLPCLVGHDDVDVVVGVAAVAEGAVSAVGAL